MNRGRRGRPHRGCLNVELVATAVLQVRSDKQAGQGHRDEAKYDTREKSFNHGYFVYGLVVLDQLHSAEP